LNIEAPLTLRMNGRGKIRIIIIPHGLRTRGRIKGPRWESPKSRPPTNLEMRQKRNCGIFALYPRPSNRGRNIEARLYVRSLASRQSRSNTTASGFETRAGHLKALRLGGESAALLHTHTLRKPPWASILKQKEDCNDAWRVRGRTYPRASKPWPPLKPQILRVTKSNSAKKSCADTHGFEPGPH